MSGFKERFSNVLSWGAGLWLIGCISISLTVFLFGRTDDDLIVEMNFAIFGVSGWIATGIVNYLLCGNFRLIPWAKKNAQGN